MKPCGRTAESRWWDSWKSSLGRGGMWRTCQCCGVPREYRLRLRARRGFRDGSRLKMLFGMVGPWARWRRTKEVNR